MRDRRTPSFREERGLVGKIIVIWLLLMVVLGLAAFDTVQILLARYKVSDAAQEASFEASNELHRSGDRRAALEAALAAVADKDKGARVTRFTHRPADAAGHRHGDEEGLDARRRARRLPEGIHESDRERYVRTRPLTLGRSR